MADPTERIERIRGRAQELAVDDGRRVEVLDRVADARDLLDAAGRKLDRAEVLLDMDDLDAGERIAGGWEVVT